MHGRTTLPQSPPLSLPLTDLDNLQIIKDCLLFDVVTGHFWRINKSAVFIVKALQQQIPVADMIKAYQQQFKVSQHVATRDIELFLNDVTSGELE
jgi:hypothetical protein